MVSPGLFVGVSAHAAGVSTCQQAAPAYSPDAVLAYSATAALPHLPPQPGHGGHPARRGHPFRPPQEKLTSNIQASEVARRRPNLVHDGVVPVRVREDAALALGAEGVGHVLL